MDGKVILGIDPGTNRTGYGIVRSEGNALHLVVLGDIDLHRIGDPYRKLQHIFERVCQLIDTYRPDEAALESPFFGANVQSMLKLGRAQGVAMAAAEPGAARLGIRAPPGQAGDHGTRVGLEGTGSFPAQKHAPYDRTAVASRRDGRAGRRRMPPFPVLGHRPDRSVAAQEGPRGRPHGQQELGRVHFVPPRPDQG